MEAWKEVVKSHAKHAINLKIAGNTEEVLGGTRFGGRPDVPKDFVWPTFETATIFDDIVKERPLSFMAQFRCADLAPYDTEALLPKTGILSFFYETLSMEWGYSPENKGCSRVYWFPAEDLQQAQFPSELEEDCRFPALAIQFSSEINVPSLEDIYDKIDTRNLDWQEYTSYCEQIGNVSQTQNEVSKLLGWADVIQNSMTIECELVSQGYEMGYGVQDIPKTVIEQAEQTSLEQWQLLFQLDTVENDTFCLMFGDCGRIYYYIKTEDLKQKRFENHWLVLQCY